MAEHKSVLLHECIENLNIRPDGIYVDGTLGLGGHSMEIVKRLTTGRLIAIDRDETAIERSKERLAPWSERITFVHGNFRDLGNILDSLGIESVNGMLFDLGVSSPQLDEAERGFSYMADAPLDMRMDQTAPVTAWTVVNTWPERELVRILRDYGEERYASRIAASDHPGPEAQATMADRLLAQITGRLKPDTPKEKPASKGKPTSKQEKAPSAGAQMSLLSGFDVPEVQAPKPKTRKKKAARKQAAPVQCETLPLPW